MNDLPLIPAIGELKGVLRLSASEFRQFRDCFLRVVFAHDPALRRMDPCTAPTLLGSAAHAALAALARATARGAQECDAARTRDVAIRVFDEALTQECIRRDAMIAERGELPGESTEPPKALPFYAMTRARLARFARQRFGEQWIWPLPRFGARPSSGKDSDRRRSSAVETEVELQSRDGLIRGIADAITEEADGIVIEEFKTGEASPDRLDGWKQQLMIYAMLYHEQYGRPPTILRVHSLASSTHEFAYVEAEAAAAVVDARKALSELNQLIAQGARPEELARPSVAACGHCPHRAWCSAYWSSSVPEASGTDVQGTIVSADGWEADLHLPSGKAIRVDFRAFQKPPILGAVVRICGARVRSAGVLACDRQTAVWRMQP